MIVDPPHLHDAASKLGKLVSAGILDFGEALDSLMRAAITAGIDDLLAIESRLSRTLAAAAMDQELAASRAIRHALQPLLARRAPKAEILKTAHFVNRKHGAVLSPRTVEAIALEEVTQRLRQINGARRAG